MQIVFSPVEGHLALLYSKKISGRFFVIIDRPTASPVNLLLIFGPGTSLL